MARNITFLGLPRYKLVAPVFGIASVTGMEPTKLENWEPWDIARINSKNPLETYLDSRIEMPLSYYGPTLSVGGVGYANHSLNLGATARTLLLDQASAGYAPVRILPNAVSGLINLTGSETDIDDDPYGSSDGNALVATGANVQARIDFTTPARNPMVGAGGQLFRVVLTWTTRPTLLSFEISEGGGAATVITFEIEGADPIPPSGSVIFLPWDADLLAAQPDGSTARLSILAAGVGVDFRVEKVDWLCQMVLSAGTVLADSGFQPATMDQVDASFGSTVSGTVGIAPQQTFGHLFDSNITGVYRFVTYFRDPLNTSGVIDLGECVAGVTFTPRINREWGDFVTMTPRDKVVQGEGGSRFGVRREPLRGMPIPLGNLSKAEADSVLDRLHRAGTLYPWMVFLFHDDAVERRHTSLYGCAHNLPRIAGRSIDYRSATFDFVEKL